MRKPLAILLTLILVCLTACVKESSVSVRLSKADEMLFTEPDSALAMLKGMKEDVQKEDDEWTRNLYKLLLIKAWNKVGSPSDQPIFPKMDSVIFDLVDYMEQSPDQSLLPQTYFQAGRVFSEEGKPEKALLYYKMAQLCDSTYVDNYLMSRILAQTGYIYLRYGMFDEATDMQEAAREYCRLAGDTMGMRFCTEDIATIAQIRDTLYVEPSKLVNNRYTVRAVNDKARYIMLKKKNEKQEAEQDGGSHGWWWTVLLLVAACLLIYYVYAQRKARGGKNDSVQPAQDDMPETGTEVKPVEQALLHQGSQERHRFYDAEVSEMLNERLKADKPLRKADWQLVESRLLEAFPTFRTSLYSLFNLSETEYRICLLTKMDMTPSQVAHLLAIGNSSVSQSRLRMQQKANNGVGTAKDWDNLVLSL